MVAKSAQRKVSELHSICLVFIYTQPQN